MDALYFRVSSDQQTIANQFADLLAVAERGHSERVRAGLARARRGNTRSGKAMASARTPEKLAHAHRVALFGFFPPPTGDFAAPEFCNSPAAVITQNQLVSVQRCFSCLEPKRVRIAFHKHASDLHGTESTPFRRAYSNSTARMTKDSQGAANEPRQ